MPDLRLTTKDRVVVFIGPYKSHINCALGLANQLRNKFDVTFASAGEIRSHIEYYGWQFQAVPLSFYNPPFSFRLFVNRFLGSLTRSTITDFRIECNEVLHVLRGIGAKVIFIDAFLSRYYPLLKELDMEVVVFETNLATNRIENIPPFTSSFIPSENLLSTIYTNVLWSCFFVKRGFIRMLLKATSFYSIHSELIKKLPKFESKDFANNSSGYPQLPMKCELILSPLAFDYPWRKIKPNQIYFGLSVDDGRTEQQHSDINLFLSRIKPDADHKLIYCSLGSIIGYNDNHHHSFLKRLREIVLRNERYRLIISLNGRHHFVNEERAIVTSFAPQLTILKHADLMILPGGLNSIQECIHFSVPMLVYPCVKNSDQNGNAARVHFHKIGLAGRLHSDTYADVEWKVNHILTNPCYKKNIEELKARIISMNERNRVWEWIGSL